MHRADEQCRQTAVAPRSRRLRVGYWGLTGVLLIAASSILGAGWLPLGQTTPWAQLVAFRPQLGAGLLVLAVVVGLLVRRLRSLCVVLAMLAAISTGTLIGRASGGLVTAPDLPVTVLSSNVQADEASVDDIVELAVTGWVDAIVLLEASRQFAASVADGARRRGLDLVSETDERLGLIQRASSSGPVATGSAPTSLLVRADLAPTFAVALPDAPLGSLIATINVEGRQLNLVAVHPAPPVPFQLDQWRADLDQVATLCTAPTIIAGDFNATLDHPPFKRLLSSGCADAAALSGNALTGTWPSSWPPPLAAPIDHILLAGPRRTVSSFGVHHITGTDHRAVLATVTP